MHSNISMTTSDSKAEGRLKVDVAMSRKKKKKILKDTIKKYY